VSRPLSTHWTSATSPAGVRLLAAEPVTLDAVPVFDPAAFGLSVGPGRGAPVGEGAGRAAGRPRRHRTRRAAGHAALTTSMAAVVAWGLLLGSGGPPGAAEARHVAPVPVIVPAPPEVVPPSAAGEVGSRFAAAGGAAGAPTAVPTSGGVDYMVDRPDGATRAMIEILEQQAAADLGARLAAVTAPGR